MEENLISKKDLLAKYGISYGALYRWKRMGLIPEEWFIKKSTVTGQETFFPKEPICKRVELIRDKKDDVSLEELANELSGKGKRDTSLLLCTVYGDKRFLFSDIRQIKLLTEDRTETDLTELIKQFMKGGK